MNNTIEFFVEGNPKAQPRPKITVQGKFGHAYYPAKSAINLWKKKVKETVQNLKDSPAVPLCGPISLYLGFIIARPDYLKNPRYPTEIIPHYKKRTDIDNLIKAVMDSITDAMLWEDDGQVYTILTTKHFAAIKGKSGVLVRIQQEEEVY